MRHFLLIYSHEHQALVDAPAEFAEDAIDDATRAYQVAESNNGSTPGIEIVLIGSDSLETIRRTHGHYFQHPDRLAKYLTGV